MAINIPIITKFNPKGIQSATAALTNFGKQAAKVALAATAAVAGIGIVSVRAFANFDAELTKSLAIMGDVSDAMRNDMSDAAREVAKTTTFSANEAAESFFFLASAGFDAAESVEAMPKVAQFAQAGMFDMATATDLLTDAQSALGLTIKGDAVANMQNLVRVSDVLVKANTLANSSVQEFSEALTNKAAPALRAVGKDVEEGAAVLAVLADQGIKGALAGNQLSIVLRDLTTKALQNGAEFRRLGIQVFDNEGNMRNLADIIGDVENATDGMSDELQKATFLQLGFSDRSLGTLQALLGTSEAIREYEGELRNAGGTAQTVAEKQLETFNAQMDLMKSRVADAGIEIGGKLAPSLLEMVEKLGPLIDESVPVFVELFEELLPVLGSVGEALPGFIEALIPMVPVMGDLALLTLSFAEAALPALETIIGEIAPVIDGLTGVLAENGEIVGALIVAVGLFTITTRIATTALLLFSGGAATAAGSSSGLFAMLAKNPFFVVAGAILAGATALFTFRREIRDSGEAGRTFLKAWTAVTFGFQAVTRGAANLVINGLNLLVNAFVARSMFAINAVRRLLDKDVITLPQLAIPTIDIIPLEEFRKEAGLTEGAFDHLTFPEVDTTGISDQITRVNRQAIAANTEISRLFGSDFSPGSEFLRAPTPGSTGGFFTDSRGLTQFRSGGGAAQTQITLNVNAGLGADGAAIGGDIIALIEQYERTSGPVFARNG